MKIIVVEDDKYKSDAVIDSLKEYIGTATFLLSESLSSGLFLLNENQDADFIILDMSMPSFDITDKDPTGGVPESYAGEDFLSQMTLMDIVVPVIVVTQYDNFGADEQQISLVKLNDKLTKNHPHIYKGSVYFKASTTSWKGELKSLLKNKGIL
jgi:CheY-like chemotaxis protein